LGYHIICILEVHPAATTLDQDAREQAWHRFNYQPRPAVFSSAPCCVNGDVTKMAAAVQFCGSINVLVRCLYATSYHPYAHAIYTSSSNTSAPLSLFDLSSSASRLVAVAWAHYIA
jgi:hypothetical protein